MDINKIYNEDCLEGFKRIENNSIDAIITDPPYGIGYKDDTGRGFRGDKQPFTMFLFESFLKLKPGGAIYVFCRWDVQEDFRTVMRLAGFKVRNQLIWDKLLGGGVGDCLRSYAPEHEVVLFGTKGDDFRFHNGRKSSVLRYKRIMPGEKNIRIHPTQKPVDLIERLITDSTDEGEIVLDCFMGSGTTAVACINTKRQYIGFEIDKTYYDLSQERIKRVLNEPKLSI